MLVPAVEPGHAGVRGRAAAHASRSTAAGSSGPGARRRDDHRAQRRRRDRPTSAESRRASSSCPIPATLPARGVHVVVGDQLARPGRARCRAAHAAHQDRARRRYGRSRTRTLPSSLPLRRGRRDRRRDDPRRGARGTDAGPAVPRRPRRAVGQAGCSSCRATSTTPIVVDSPGRVDLRRDDLELDRRRPAAGRLERLPVRSRSRSPPAASAPCSRGSSSRSAPQAREVIEAIQPRLARCPGRRPPGGDQARSARPRTPARWSRRSGEQLLLDPGRGGRRHASMPSRATTRTVVELQLHAMFAVRVRVNGAESIDPRRVELPQ